MSVFVWNTVGVQHSALTLPSENSLCDVVTSQGPTLLLQGSLSLSLPLSLLQQLILNTEDRAILYLSLILGDGGGDPRE